MRPARERNAHNLAPRAAIALTLMLVGLSVLFFWWGWRQGAYFDAVFFPGAICVFLLLAVLPASAPFDRRLGGAPLLALLSLVLIAAWMLISLLWTSTQAAAVLYTQHAFLYGALFMMGMWVCVLLTKEESLSIAPVAVAGVAVGVATTITLAGSTNLDALMHGDATLRFPMGYRNANAALFLVFLWPVMALAGDRGRPWPARAIMIGGATVLVELAVLSQSRGSAPAALIAAVVWIAFSPARLHAAALLALVAVPAAIAAPTLLDVFQYGEADPAILPLLRDAARVIALTSLASLVPAAVYMAWFEPRVSLRPDTRRRVGWGLTATAVVVAGLAVAILTADSGGPVKFVDRRVSEFTGGGITNFSGKGARFGVNVGSNRDDFWRVSLDQAKDAPILGGGAGSFQLTYLRHRQSPESPRDPHSVEMMMLSELGLPGLLLFATFLGAVLVGAVRARRRGFEPALVAAGAVGATVYWAIAASYDWLWNYPILTGLVAYMAGAAVAPALAGGGGISGKTRIALASCSLALALTAVPLYLSARYTNRAVKEWRESPGVAYEDLDRAADLNPFDTSALLYKQGIATALGDDAVAIAAMREAVDREPDNYAPHLFLARDLLRANPAAARAQLAIARRLNPLEESLGRLAKALRAQRAGAGRRVPPAQ